MAKWGWHDVDPGFVDGEFFNDGGNYELGNAFNALGLNPYADDEDAEPRGYNKCYWVMHSDPNKVDEHEMPIQPADQYYQADGAQYRVRIRSLLFFVRY